MKIALITGASSGLGAEFLDAIVENYNTIEEIWLIARRKEQLIQLSKKYPKTKIRILALDLSEEASYKLLSKTLKEEKATIRILINNAGVDFRGCFENLSYDAIMAMIKVNVLGVTLLNHICLPFMKKGSVEIITSSVASFMPIPNQSVYSASKIYDRYLGYALHSELKKRGIKVLVLCPGNMDTAMKPKVEQSPIVQLTYLDMKKVTRLALQKVENGQRIYTPYVIYKIARVLCKIVPSRLMHF